MKLRRGIRKTVKLCGCVLSVVLLCALIGSRWWGLVRVGYTWICNISHGSIELRFLNSGFGVGPTGWVAQRNIQPGFDDWLPHRVGDFTAGELVIPLWIPLTLVLIPIYFAWRLDARARRRAGKNRCPTCNYYDRTGLAPSAPCPECGTKPAGTPP